ncbi:MAG: hypothetical protein Tsb0015_04070 [Simkaniaceae bacterium]
MAEDITKTSSFDLRYTEMQDEKHLLQWLEDPSVLQWFPMNSKEETLQFTKNWIGFSRFKCSLTATVEHVPRGIGTLFLMPYRKVAHLCMVYLAVDPKYQRRGIGSSLVKNLGHLAHNYFRLESMHFELYEGCPLIPLLQKFGYYECFRQEKFVKDSQGNYLARHIFEVSFLHD